VRRLLPRGGPSAALWVAAARLWMRWRWRWTVRRRCRRFLAAAPGDDLLALEIALRSPPSRSPAAVPSSFPCPGCKTADLCGLTGCRSMSSAAFLARAVQPGGALAPPDPARVAAAYGAAAVVPPPGAVQTAPAAADEVVLLTEEMRVVSEPAQPNGAAAPAAAAPGSELRVLRVANGWIVSLAAPPGVSAVGPDSHVATDAAGLARVITGLAGA